MFFVLLMCVDGMEFDRMTKKKILFSFTMEVQLKRILSDSQTRGTESKRKKNTTPPLNSLAEKNTVIISSRFQVFSPSRFNRFSYLTMYRDVSHAQTKYNSNRISTFCTTPGSVVKPTRQWKFSGNKAFHSFVFRPIASICLFLFLVDFSSFNEIHVSTLDISPLYMVQKMPIVTEPVQTKLTETPLEPIGPLDTKVSPCLVSRPASLLLLTSFSSAENDRRMSRAGVHGLAADLR